MMLQGRQAVEALAATHPCCGKASCSGHVPHHLPRAACSPLQVASIAKLQVGTPYALILSDAKAGPLTKYL